MLYRDKQLSPNPSQSFIKHWVYMLRLKMHNRITC